MSIWSDLVGTIGSTFRLGFQGVTLKSASGKLQVRNAGDTAPASVVVSTLELGSGNTVLQSGGSGISITFPSNAGSPNQAIVTDGAGNWSYATLAGGNDKPVVDTTSLVFGSASTVSMFTLPANAVITEIRMIVDTAFNGTPTASIGIAGQLSKYTASTSSDLTTTGTYTLYPDLPASGSSENLIITYAPGGATAGAARILVEYVIPS